MTPATATRRPRISAEFLHTNTKTRILNGTAKVIAATNYRTASVADIVRVSRCARNTFYGCYGGKEAAALALVEAFGVELEDLKETPSVVALAVELAARDRNGEQVTAREQLQQASQAIRFFVDCEIRDRPANDDPREGTLPPGRHGLPAEFIEANQRARLLAGCAVAISERGWEGARVSDVTDAAATSRRTFYEHYTAGMDAVGLAMVDEAVGPSPVADLDLRSGLAGVCMEVLAGRLVNGGRPAVADQALVALGMVEGAAE